MDASRSATGGALRRRLRRRLLDGMIRRVGGGRSQWKVLVVDREALRILAAALGGLNGLVDEGITIIEMLDMRREPLPRIPAVFFVAPSAESVAHLVAEAPRQYAEFHLFFTHRVGDFHMQQLRAAPMLRRVKSFVDLDVELLATEARVFSLDRPGASIPQLFASGAREALDEMSVLSERLTDVCGVVAPELDWTVRADAASQRARTVASLVKEQLETVKIKARADRAKREEEGGAEEDFRCMAPEDDEVCPTKATLLVVDRASDLVSPLMHEFSYQAMAHDLLKLDYLKPGGVHYDLPNEEDPSSPKSVLLDDEATDTTWVATRHLFVQEAKDEAQARFKRFLATDAAYKIRGKDGGEVDISEMSAAVRSLPESQKRADQFALHIVALSECLRLCGAHRLTELAVAEQDLAIGRHPDTTRARPDAVVETLTSLVHAPDIPLDHRARLLMLAIAVAEGTVALGAEASLLALTPSFKTRLSRSSVANIPDLDPATASTVKGFQVLLAKAREAADALAQRSGARAAHAHADGNFAENLRHKYVERRNVKAKEKEIEARRRRNHGRAAEDAQVGYDVARYLPPLMSVALDLVDETLAEDAFPTTGAVSVDSIISNMGGSSLDARGGRAGGAHGHARAALASSRAALARARSHDSRDSADDEQFKQADREHLYVIFFVGGVTFSEVRSVYDVCARREANILVGGSQILTPRMFMDACASIADPVTRMKVMLPPLPIELAQSRAARERTMQEGAAREKREASERAAQKKDSRGDASSAGSRREMDAASDDADDDEPVDVVVVTGYQKKSRAKKFGRKVGKLF